MSVSETLMQEGCKYVGKTCGWSVKRLSFAILKESIVELKSQRDPLRSGYRLVRVEPL